MRIETSMTFGNVGGDGRAWLQIVDDEDNLVWVVAVSDLDVDGAVGHPEVYANDSSRCAEQCSQ
jgi:hypothetical protein